MIELKKHLLNRYLLATAGLLGLTVTGALMDSRKAIAQGATPVTVTNSPLLVEGTMHIAAPQHGSIPVNVNHLPPVEVVVKTPYHMHLSSSVFLAVGFPAIPLGKRLVLQYVSATVELNAPLSVAGGLDLDDGALTPLLHLPINRQATIASTDVWVASQSVTSYIDEGTIIVVRVPGGVFPSGPIHSIDATLDGYLEDMP